RIDVPRMVGRRKNEDAFVVRLQPVQLGEELHDDLAESRPVAELASLPPECVDLVDEEHARCVSACILEELVELSLAFAEPHVEYVMETDAEEAGAELACRRTSEKRLATAGWPPQQHAATKRFR